MQRIFKITMFTLMLSCMSGMAAAVPPSPGDYVVTDQIGILGVTPAGVTSTIANGPPLVFPWKVVIDSSGNFIVTDPSSSGGSLFSITPAGVVSTIATGLNAYGLTIDASGNYIIGNYTGTLSSVTPGGVITTIATGLGQLTGNMAIDANGDFILTEQHGRLMRVTTGGIATEIAPAIALHSPTGVVIDVGGDFIVSTETGSILRVTPAGTVTTIAAGLGRLMGIAMDSFGDFIVADMGDFYSPPQVLKVTPAGLVTVVVSGNPPLYGASGVTVVPPALFISPASGKLATTQAFDLILVAEGGTATVVSADLDGGDVTGGLSNCVVPGTLVPPSPFGSTLSCSITGATVGVGTHTFTVTVDVSGTPVTSSVTWDVLNATQP